MKGMTMLLLIFGMAPPVFSAETNHLLVNTPQGKFECSGGGTTNYHQVLKIDGKIIYDERLSDNRGIYFQDNRGATALSNGIYMGSGIDGNCPVIIGNKTGYLLIERQFSSPGSGGEASAGIYGIGIINFNASPPMISELTELQADNDSTKHRVKWDDKGFTMVYYGYPLGMSAGSTDSPKPAAHKIRFNFSSGTAFQIK